MSAKDQIKQIVDFFKKEPQLKDKTDGMAEGLLLGAQLADDANELSKETDASFKALQREYTENGNGSQTTAEITVARDGELVLDDRLKRDFGNVNAQLAQNKLNDEQLRSLVELLQQQVTNMGDISPEPFLTYTDLVNANPPRTGVYVVLETGDWYYWDSVNSEWAVGGMFQSSRVGDKTITAGKTTFAKPGKNLWDGKYLNAAITGTPPNGTLSASNGTSAVSIPLNKNGTYRVSVESGPDRFRIATSVNHPLIGAALTRYISSNDIERNRTVTLQGDEQYIIAYVSSAEQRMTPARFMIEEGDTTTEYESPDEVMINFSENQQFVLKENQVTSIEIDTYAVEKENIAPKSVTADKTTFLGPGKNLWDGNYIVNRSLVGSTPNGTIGTLEGATSVIIPTKKDIDVTITRDYGSSNRFRVAASVGYPEPGKSVRYIQANDIGSLLRVKLEGDEDHLFIYVSTDSNNLPKGLMVQEGNVQREYEEPGKVTVDFSEIQKFGTFSKQIFLSNAVLENYSSMQEYTNPYMASIEDLYAEYESLLANLPGYVSQKEWGVGSSEHMIYQYDFKPQALQHPLNINAINPPKINIIWGTHGFEKDAIWAGLKFLKDVCYNWRNNSFLEAIRWGVHLCVIPCLNPAGYALNTRKNANGVDINRNGPDGWETNAGNTDPASMDYKGPAPASEPETQIMLNFMKDNNDAFFTIDHHNSSNFETQGHVIWVGALNNDVRKMGAGFTNYMSGKIKKDFTVFEDDAHLGYISSSGISTVAYQAEMADIDSALLETAVKVGTGEETQKFNTDAIGNFLLSVLKAYS